MTEEELQARHTMAMSFGFGGCDTLAELDQLHLSDFVNQIHVIVGDGGKCMCGVYDGNPRTCVDIIKGKSSQILNATIIAEVGERWGPYHLHPDGWWRLFASQKAGEK